MKKFILIEAKEISGIRFVFSRLTPKQLQQLSAIELHGGIGIILFYIKEMKINLCVKIDRLLVYMEQTNKKSININALIKIGTNFKLEDINELLNQLVN